MVVSFKDLEVGSYFIVKTKVTPKKSSVYVKISPMKIAYQKVDERNFCPDAVVNCHTALSGMNDIVYISCPDEALVQEVC